MTRGEEKKHTPQSLGEEIGNAVTHGVGFLLSIVGFILLLVNSKNGIEVFASIIFGLSMMLLYISSCLYHAFRKDSAVKSLFRRFDHISIYLLIAGTFAPLLLIFIGGPLGWTFFYIQWIIVIAGIVLKAIFPTRFLILNLIFYLILGWSGLFFLPRLYHDSIELMWMILAGGLVYTVGVLFYKGLKFKYSHFVWHFFVLGGTIVQFLGILIYVYMR